MATLAGTKRAQARLDTAVLASLFFFLVVDLILYPLFGALAGYAAVALTRQPPPVTS